MQEIILILLSLVILILIFILYLFYNKNLKEDIEKENLQVQMLNFRNDIKDKDFNNLENKLDDKLNNSYNNLKEVNTLLTDFKKELTNTIGINKEEILKLSNENKEKINENIDNKYNKIVDVNNKISTNISNFKVENKENIERNFNILTNKLNENLKVKLDENITGFKSIEEKLIILEQTKKSIDNVKLSIDKLNDFFILPPNEKFSSKFLVKQLLENYPNSFDLVNLKVELDFANIKILLDENISYSMCIYIGENFESDYEKILDKFSNIESNVDKVILIESESKYISIMSNENLYDKYVKKASYYDISVLNISNLKLILDGKRQIFLDKKLKMQAKILLEYIKKMGENYGILDNYYNTIKNLLDTLKENLDRNKEFYISTYYNNINDIKTNNITKEITGDMND